MTLIKAAYLKHLKFYLCTSVLQELRILKNTAFLDTSEGLSSI